MNYPKGGLCRSTLVLASFCCFAVLGQVYGQEKANRLSAKVVDSFGATVSGCEVSIEFENPKRIVVGVTDAGGSYTFVNVKPGRYSITVRSVGFETMSKEINVESEREVTLTIEPAKVAATIMVSSSYLAGTTESLSEVPGSIDRIDQHTLNASRVFNFSEALRKIPGVNVREEEGFGLRPNIGIRGTNPTRSTKVLLLEDGVPLSYAPYGDNASYYHPPIERYDSIEVMKGSSQIAFGPQTIAGVINYLTPNPSDKPSFSLALRGGNRSFFNGSFTGSGTIGKTGVYVNYTRKQGDGSRENTSSKLNDVLAKVVQAVNDRNVLTFKGTYYGEDSNVTYSGLTTAEYAAAPRSNPFKNDFFYGDRVGTAIGHTVVFTPKVTLTTNAYFNQFDRDWWRQSSNSGQRPNRLNVDPDCLSMAQLDTTCGNEGRLRSYRTIGVEPRLSFSYESGTKFRGELQAGVRFHGEYQRRRQLNGDLPNSRDGVVSEFNLRRNNSQSAFIQNRFIFGDLSFTPGVRYERIEIERENRMSNPATLGRTVLETAIPGVGVAFSGIPRTTIFAGIHRGFSPPRAEDIISATGSVIDLEPEKSWNYEIGVRTNPFAGVRMEAAFFRLDYSNQLVPASLAGGVGSLLTNGGETQQQGMEFGAGLDTGQIIRSNHNFYFRGAFTFLTTAEFRGARFSSVTPSISVSGNRLPYTPETQATVSFGYSHPIGVNAFVENVYLSEQFSDDLNTITPIASGQRGIIGSQSYWNATANYTVERWKTTFFVTAKNLAGTTNIVDRSRGILPSNPRGIQTGINIRF